jgi:3-oxocholest-4-en-26-oyl-CoA dehydrogenase beta subunit
MDLTLTAEQELIAQTAREFLDARWQASRARAMADEPSGYSEQLWKEIVDLGWAGLALPEDHGGAGGSFLDLCLVVEEMGRAQLPSPFVTTTVSCALPIARFGTREQRAMYLEAVAAGSKVMSYVGRDPRGRWDPPGSDVVATGGQDGYALEGNALFVPYAEAAHDLLVVARHDSGAPDALTAFLVSTDSPGLAVDRLRTIGTDRTHRVGFDGVRAAAGDVLGDIGDGLVVARTATVLTAGALCAQMVGGAQRVLDLTLAHAKSRDQFGRPIGSFQAVQHHCADMAIDVLGARLLTYEAIWRLSEGIDADLEVSVAKAWTSDAYRRVCALGHQVHGAIGFTEEHDLHLYLRHAAEAELTLGDGDEHRELIAQHLSI